MKTSEILDFYRDAEPDLLTDTQAAFLAGETDPSGAAAEMALADGRCMAFWLGSDADGKTDLKNEGGASAVHLRLGQAAALEKAGFPRADCRAVSLLANGRFRLAEWMTVEKQTVVVTQALSPERLAEALGLCGIRALPPLWAEAETAAGKAALELDADTAALLGLRLFPAAAKTQALLAALQKAGLCSPMAAARCLDWQRLYPRAVPPMCARLDFVALRTVQGGQTAAYARLGLSDQVNYQVDALASPITMNLELTTRCPLHCPQCYCSLNTGKELALDKALHWIEQAGKEHVQIMDLSGGETLCYPWLNEVVAAAAKVCPQVNVALSGWGFDNEAYDKLVAAGVTGIFVSLNGPTEEINRQSRDGYLLAIRALALLQRRGFQNTFINWVMHNSNADSLPDMLALAERYHVGTLMVMAFKPDSSHALPSLPTREQMHRTAELIRNYHGPVKIGVEACFSPMRALTCQSFFGNQNVGVLKGCGAGRDAISVNVDGLLSPCRHLDYFEAYDTIHEYWTRSETVRKLRATERDARTPCASCRWLPNCRHCMAINTKLNGEIYLGNATCPIAEEES